MSSHVLDRYQEYVDAELADRIRKASDFHELHDIVFPIHKNKENLGIREHRRQMKRLVAAILYSESNLGKMYRYGDLVAILNSMDPNSLLQMCPIVGITIPPKVRKKGKRHIIERMMDKYHTNPRVRNNISRMMEQNIYSTAPFLRNEDVKFADFVKSVKDFVESSNRQVDVNTALVNLYMVTMIIGKHRLAMYIARMFKAETWRYFEHATVQAFMIYKWFSQSMNDRKNQMNFEDVLKEQEKLKNEIKKQAKQQADLKRALYEKNRKEKELKSKIHELNAQLRQQLEDAVAEIQRLEMKLEEQKRYYLNEIQQMAEQHATEILHLQNEIAVLRTMNGQSDGLDSESSDKSVESNESYESVDAFKPLKGLNVLVIGHQRKKNKYRKIVERYGGNFEFHPSSPGSSLSRVEGMARRADVIFYLTTFTSHTVENKLGAVVPVEKIWFLYAGGINYFESRLLEYIQSISSNAS